MAIENIIFLLIAYRRDFLRTTFHSKQVNLRYAVRRLSSSLFVRNEVLKVFSGTRLSLHEFLKHAIAITAQ